MPISNHLDVIFEFYDEEMCKEIDNIERTNWSNIWQQKRIY